MRSSHPQKHPGQRSNEEEELNLFENSPISLWLEDFSGVKRKLDDWRAQRIGDLSSYLKLNPEEVDECKNLIRVVDVNHKTLELFGAHSREELMENLGVIFHGEMREHFRDELVDMYAGKLSYEREGINYALDGRAVDVCVHFAVLPGYEQTFERVLVALDDISARKQAERNTQASEAHFSGLFENSPISLWEEDFSGVKQVLDGLRGAGVSDLASYLDEHPEIVEKCEKLIRVLHVNKKTLELFGAKKEAELLANLDKVFKAEMRRHFRDILLDMWAGKLAYEREGINYSLKGNPINVHIYWSVLPGHELTFARAIVALEDITARKKAEDYMKYLGTHDVMTGMYNRATFEEEITRLKQNPVWPVTILVGDLDGLKYVNDTLGHQAGDALIRRAAEVLRASFTRPVVAARIGGDEFAVILPGMDENEAQKALERVNSLTALNNTFYQGPVLNISMGAATGHDWTELNEVFREADDRMYQAKRKRRAAGG